MAANKKDIFELDLYELLGIHFDCTTQEVKKAYRKKALSCHPDKNPDNPKAAELFHELSKALEILIDESARAAYDKVLKGRRAAKLRHRELDSRRKKLKEDLEARERAAEKSSTSSSHDFVDTKADEARLKAQIERLRKEGSKQLAEEIALVQRQVEEERIGRTHTTEILEDASHSHRLKIRWQATKDDEDNGGYSYETLHKMLSKYGDIVALIMSKKRGSAMVEFVGKEAASMAYELEKGYISNPLTVEYVDGSNVQKKKESGSTGSAPTTLVSDSDFENLVFRRMRQAEERKRLIEQIEAEEG